jgi:molybdenum cofactor biosynthesis protein B
VDAVRPLLEKEMPGFGEVFRSLSYVEVRGPAILSRATAGVAAGKLVYCLPGSRGAMSLALNELILPNIGHTLWELNRK